MSFKINIDGAIDPKFVLQCYDKYGTDFPKHISGAFAISLWDEEKRRLFLARDRIGQKPLFYCINSGRIQYSSTLKGIDAPKRIDMDALCEYFAFQYVPYPKTIFQGIFRVEPAHILEIGENGIVIKKRYWNAFEIAVNREPFALQTELRDLTEDSVKKCADTEEQPVTFLSGGIDSTVITGLFTKISKSQVKTFCCGFDEKEYDESKFARETALRLGTEHHEIIVRPNVAEILPKMMTHFDEPFADSSMIPMWALCEEAAKHSKFALTGDGGDELFAGYERYLAMSLGALLDYCPLFLRKLLPLFPASRRIKRFLDTAALSPKERYFQFVSAFNREQLASLFGIVQKNVQTDPLAVWEPFFQMMRENNIANAAAQYSLLDLHTYYPGDLAPKVDVIGKAHGIECRAPLLDDRILELSLRIPIWHKISIKKGKLKGKQIMRQAFSDLIPKTLRNRRKMGFGVPLDSWLRGPLKSYAQDILLDKQAKGRDYIDYKYVAELLTEHFIGRRNHSPRIWALLAFEIWLQNI